MANPTQMLLILLLRVYRAVVSPALSVVFGATGLGCRYEPTCSVYAIEAVQHHGAFRGTALTVKRLCRCHPWGGFGHDPVPRRANQGIISTESPAVLRAQANRLAR